MGGKGTEQIGADFATSSHKHHQRRAEEEQEREKSRLKIRVCAGVAEEGPGSGARSCAANYHQKKKGQLLYNYHLALSTFNLSARPREPGEGVELRT